MPEPRLPPIIEPAAPHVGADNFDLLPVGVSVWDAAGRITAWNAACAEMWGYTAEEAIGRHAVELAVAPADADLGADLGADLLAGNAWEGEFPVVRRDGSLVRGWFSMRPLVDGAGELEAVVVVSRCLDAEPDQAAVEPLERNVHDQAEHATALLRSVLTAAPIGLAFFDRDLRYTVVNSAIAAINGVPAADHIGRTIPEVLGGSWSEVEATMRRVLETGEPVEASEVHGETPLLPGTRRSWLVTYFPVEVRGSVQWVGVTALEITAREQVERRLGRLQAFTAALSSARTVGEVADVVVEQSAGAIDVDEVALLVRRSDPDRLERIGWRGYDSSPDPARYAVLRVEDQWPATDAVRTGVPVELPDAATRIERYPALEGLPVGDVHLVLPLALDGPPIGALVLGWAGGSLPGSDDRQLLDAVARLAAQALDRARLFEAERDARRRLSVLSEAGRVLGTTLDAYAALSAIGELLVPEVADLATLYLVDDNGLLHRVAVRHRDAELEALHRRVTDRMDPTRNPVLLEVAESGRTLLLPAIEDELFVRVAVDADHLEDLRRTATSSGAVVPLVHAGHTVGIIGLGQVDRLSGRRFGGEDLAFLDELGARLAMGLENARGYERLQRIADSLQAALRPPARAAVPGLDVATCYRPVGGTDVGGDFFDVYRLDGGAHGVAIGDVSGKGVQAASLTAMARYTVRAAAQAGLGPAAALAAAHRAVCEAEVGEAFCTVVALELRPAASGGGAHEVRLASGGHPLPLVLRADGTVEEVGAPGSAIGLLDDAAHTEVGTTLHPGDVLVLYTDGVTEARGADGSFHPELLDATLPPLAGRPASELVDELVVAVDRVQPVQRDDLAIVALRVPA